MHTLASRGLPTASPTETPLLHQKKQTHARHLHAIDRQTGTAGTSRPKSIVCCIAEHSQHPPCLDTGTLSLPAYAQRGIEIPKGGGEAPSKLTTSPIQKCSSSKHSMTAVRRVSSKMHGTAYPHHHAMQHRWLAGEEPSPSAPAKLGKCTDWSIDASSHTYRTRTPWHKIHLSSCRYSSRMASLGGSGDRHANANGLNVTTPPLTQDRETAPYLPDQQHMLLQHGFIPAMATNTRPAHY